MKPGKQWASREDWSAWLFWLSHAYFLCIIVLFWVRQIVSIYNGNPPLIGWMISAEIAIIITAWLTFTTLQTTSGRERLGLQLLLVQFGVIIAGNTIVIVLELQEGIRPQAWDNRIFMFDALGLYALMIAAALGWLRPFSAWAKCWYTVVLKSLPQLLQALSVMNGNGTLDMMGAFFLISQAFGRWLPPFLARQRTKSTVSTPLKALSFSTSADLLTTLLIFGAVQYAS